MEGFKLLGLDNQRLSELNDDELRNSFIELSHLFTFLMEGSQAGYWDWHIQKNYEYLSPTFKSMFGYEDHEIENHPDSWMKIIHQDDLPKVLELFDAHIKSKGTVPYDNEVRYHHKDGSIVWVFCRGKVIEWGPNGEPLRMVGTHVDITKQKEAELDAIEKSEKILLNEKKLNALTQEVIQKNEELNETNAELSATVSYLNQTLNNLNNEKKKLDRVLNQVSHDVRAPLATIRTFLNYIRVTKNFKPEMIEQLDEQVIRTTEYVDNLLNSVLSSANITNEIIDLELFINNCIQDVSFIRDKKNVDIRVYVPTDLKLETDPTNLRSILSNLINNAVKYADPKKDNSYVEVNANVSLPYVVFTITDNGIGIEKNKIKKIFDRHYQANDRSEGHGLGLFLVQDSVRLLEGHIKLQSELGVGTSFEVKIPNKIYLFRGC